MVGPYRAVLGLGVAGLGVAGAVAVGVWRLGPSDEGGAPGGGGAPRARLAFVEPVVATTSASLETGGGVVDVTVRREDRETVCIDVEGLVSSTSCGPTFAAAAALPEGFGRARIGDRDVVVVAGVAEASTDRVVLVFPNGATIEGAVDTLPGRVERAFAAVAFLPADDGDGPVPVRYRLFDSSGALLHDAAA